MFPQDKDGNQSISRAQGQAPQIQYAQPTEYVGNKYLTQTPQGPIGVRQKEQLGSHYGFKNVYGQNYVGDGKWLSNTPNKPIYMKNDPHTVVTHPELPNYMQALGRSVMSQAPSVQTMQHAGGNSYQMLPEPVRPVYGRIHDPALTYAPMEQDYRPNPSVINLNSRVLDPAFEDVYLRRALLKAFGPASATTPSAPVVDDDGSSQRWR